MVCRVHQPVTRVVGDQFHPVLSRRWLTVLLGQTRALRKGYKIGTCVQSQDGAGDLRVLPLDITPTDGRFGG